MGFNVNIYNLALFNIGWLACVLGGDQLAIVAVLCITWVHLSLVSGERYELFWLLAVTAIGVVVDTVFFTVGILEPASQGQGLPLPPLWMMCLWWLFATTLGYGFQWFANRAVLAALLGGVAGPLSYYGGANLAGVTINTDIGSLALLVACWALLFPLLISAANLFQLRFGYR